ncbi:hypothetical protein FOXYSP1_05323 [Fusarium oxysporum f. sp. phaseoli]
MANVTLAIQLANFHVHCALVPSKAVQSALCILKLRKAVCLCDEFQSTRNIWFRCDCSDIVIQALLGLSSRSDIKHVIKPSEGARERERLAISGPGRKLRTCRRLTPGLYNEIGNVSVNGLERPGGCDSRASRTCPAMAMTAHDGVISQSLRINGMDKRQFRPAHNSTVIVLPIDENAPMAKKLFITTKQPSPSITRLLSMEVFNADGADHSEQRTLVFGIGVVGHTLIFNITAHPLLRYDGVGLSQNEVHGKAEENGLDSLISKLDLGYDVLQSLYMHYDTLCINVRCSECFGTHGSFYTLCGDFR